MNLVKDFPVITGNKRKIASMMKQSVEGNGMTGKDNSKRNLILAGNDADTA